MWRKSMLAVVMAALVQWARAVAPVAFTFEVPDNGRDPLAREIWAEVKTPAHGTVRLPAFYRGNGKFEVRARADATGEYRLGQVSEGGPLAAKAVGSAKFTVRAAGTLSQVSVAGRKFQLADGTPFGPIGVNLAWPQGEPVAWYRDALKQLNAAGLNWTRIWMSHWGGLNLDWRVDGHAVPVGQLDLEIAERWDQIVAAAEDNGVHFQFVLQHHGQWVSKGANPNWAGNPWNAKHPGGFLDRAADFFASPHAGELTRQKYRYIVARWGYSPAIMAWELFNEVHWTDALAIDGDVAAVAQWHTAMAGFIRSVDTYHHLVTTSLEDLDSPIYAAMDYYQPHLYATNMLAAVRRFDRDPATLSKPVFYGEMGDDHMLLTPEQADSVVELPAIAWASLTGAARYPAQVWDGWRILSKHRAGEIGAVARFLKETGIAEEEGLQPFSALVTGAPTMPLVVEPGETWKKRGAVELTMPTDGREVSEVALVPRIMVGAAQSIREGYAWKLTLHVNYPRAANATVRIADGGSGSAAARVQLDGVNVGEEHWPILPNGTKELAPRPKNLTFAVSAGAHTLVVDNPGGEDWIALNGVDLGLETPVLATQGRRNERFISLWIWNRQAVFAVNEPARVRGTIQLDGVGAGRWRIAWWDTQKGQPTEVRQIVHPGGLLELATPPIGRHAALVLRRED